MNETVTPEVSAEAKEAAVPKPGAILRDERERQSLTLTDVARQLKLFPRQVDALERDDYGALPGPVFVRGFARNYARLLGIDAELLIRSFEGKLSPGKVDGGAESSPVPRPGLAAALPNADAVTTSGRRRRLLYVVSATIILVSAYFAIRDQTPRPAPVDVPVVVTPSDAPALPPAPLSTTIPEASQTPGSVAPAPSETVPARPAAVTSRSPEMETSTGTTGPELRLTFSGESWVEVRNGKGTLVFGQLNPEGSVRIVRGTPPLSLVVGNASRVSLTFRGKPVDLEPHTRTGVARLTVE